MICSLEALEQLAFPETGVSDLQAQRMCSGCGITKRRQNGSMFDDVASDSMLKGHGQTCICLPAHSVMFRWLADTSTNFIWSSRPAAAAPWLCFWQDVELGAQPSPEPVLYPLTVITDCYAWLPLSTPVLQHPHVPFFSRPLNSTNGLSRHFCVPRARFPGAARTPHTATRPDPSRARRPSCSTLATPCRGRAERHSSFFPTTHRNLRRYRIRP
jgi:hypothetical protein